MTPSNEATRPGGASRQPLRREAIRTTVANRGPAGAEPRSTSKKDNASTADYREATDFLKWLRPGGPWLLTAIDPTSGKIETITARNKTEARDFIRGHDGARNLYYSVNPTRTAMTRKAAKVDIAAIEYLLGDLDPHDGESPEDAKARYLKALKTFKPAVTAIIDSGNGIQGLWKLATPIELPEPVMETDTKGKTTRAFTPETAAIIADAEARSAALMERLGSVAGTQNIDRILRVPGTTNLPNQKKLKAGRGACAATLIRFNGSRYPLDAFPAPKPGVGTVDGAGIDALPISKRIKDLIRGVHNPKHPYASRSEAVFAVILAMVGGGCADNQIEAVFLDASHPISAHVLEQPKPPEYLARQIAKARKADPHVARINEHYALVIVGDKSMILKTTDDDIKFWTLQAFEQWHANQYVPSRANRKVPLARHWMHHSERRQYEGIVFAPGRDVPNHFNLWRGFAVEPKPGDCSRFLAHLRENVCCGDEELYKWVIGWFANIFQHPEQKMGTSLVLRGNMGTGKTKVGEVFGSLLGTHYVPVSDPRYVTGRFNSHLMSCLLLHCDEAFWAGDRVAEGKLKDLITGQDHLIEFKGKEPIKVRNYVRLLVTGNPDWLVPAGVEERRFAVLDIGEGHMQDKAYFAAIDEQMDNGGQQALLYHLLKFDLKNVDLRTIPRTTALLDQKISTFNPMQGWWLCTLMRGALPGLLPGDSPKGYWTCPSASIFDLYIDHSQKQGIRRRSLEVQIGMFLNKHVPGLRKREIATKDEVSNSKIDRNFRTEPFRNNVYDFPPLAKCREAFAKTLQQDIVWPEQSDWKEWPANFATGKFA
jgi:Family of unknown function (DUF5906)